MAEQVGLTTEAPVGEQQHHSFPSRRYVGKKETLGFILFHSATNLNINKYKERFVLDVLKIDLGWLSALTIINSIWDVINDTFIGIMVDRTRTRWGKFKPYLVVTAIVTAVLGSLFWMLPLFFNIDPRSMTKAVAYLLLAMTREISDTFRSISENGITATITPHPKDRTRLITSAKLYNGIVPSGLAELLMGLFIDLVNHDAISVDMRSIYVFMGVFTTIGAAGLALYFFLVVHERVVQSVQAPSTRDSLRSIIKNKPLLIMAASSFGEALKLQGGMDNYYIDVLGAASIKNIVGIPGSFVSPVSYAYVPWLKERFSTKALWIIGSDIGDWLMGLVFFVGIIGGTGKDGWYQKRTIMIIAIMIQETLFMIFMGVRRIIPIEIQNETMDYCEWKFGYRTEGMTVVSLNYAKKIISAITGGLRPLIMGKLGYDLTKGFGEQSDKAKFGLFALGTIIPGVTGSFDSIARLFYDLTGEKRERMYYELLARRAETQKNLSVQDAQADEVGTEK